MAYRTPQVDPRTVRLSMLPDSPSPSTVLPLSSVHDYDGAARDLAAGRFGSDVAVADGESGARMSAERAWEFHERLTELVQEFFAPEAAEWTSAVKYGFRFVLMPVDTAPPDDSRVRSANRE